MSYEYVDSLNRGDGANRFRYQGFAERVAAIDVDITAHGAASHEQRALPKDGESGTFFRDEMIRLRDIDTSYSYRDFCSQVRSISGSMGQLLFHRSRVVDAIIESLEDSSSVAWPSVLELTGVLARDLREELYPEVPRLVRALAKMLDPSKPELTAGAFRALGYVFKFLSDVLAANLDDVKGWYGALLGNSKEFVRRFAAESFALLLRRLEPDALLGHVASLVKVIGAPARKSDEVDEVALQPASLRDGIARLVAELCRGSRGVLHSGARDVLVAVASAGRPKRPKSLRSLPKPAKGAVVRTSQLEAAAAAFVPDAELSDSIARGALRHELLHRAVCQMAAAMDGGKDCKVLWRVVASEAKEAATRMAAARAAAASKDEAVAAAGISHCTELGYCVARHCGTALTLVTARGGRISAAHAVTVTKAVKALLAASSFVSASTPTAARVAVVRLVAAAWPLMSGILEPAAARAGGSSASSSSSAAAAAAASAAAAGRGGDEDSDDEDGEGDGADGDEQDAEVAALLSGVQKRLQKLKRGEGKRAAAGKRGGAAASGALLRPETLRAVIADITALAPDATCIRAPVLPAAIAALASCPLPADPALQGESHGAADAAAHQAASQHSRARARAVAAGETGSTTTGDSPDELRMADPFDGTDSSDPLPAAAIVTSALRSIVEHSAAGLVGASGLTERAQERASESSTLATRALLTYLDSVAGQAGAVLPEPAPAGPGASPSRHRAPATPAESFARQTAISGILALHATLHGACVSPSTATGQAPPPLGLPSHRRQSFASSVVLTAAGRLRTFRRRRDGTNVATGASAGSQVAALVDSLAANGSWHKASPAEAWSALEASSAIEPQNWNARAAMLRVALPDTVALSRAFTQAAAGAAGEDSSRRGGLSEACWTMRRASTCFAELASAAEDKTAVEIRRSEVELAMAAAAEAGGIVADALNTTYAGFQPSEELARARLAASAALALLEGCARLLAVARAGSGSGALRQSFSAAGFETLALSRLVDALACPDRAVRLAALRCLACFDEPKWDGPGSSSRQSSSGAADAQLEDDDSEDEDEDEADADRKSDDDESSDSDDEATGKRDALANSDTQTSCIGMLAEAEALEVTLIAERARLTRLDAVARAATMKRLHPAVIRAAASALIGTLFLRFAPGNVAACKGLRALANASPHTVWPRMARHVLLVTSARPRGGTVGPRTSASQSIAGLTPALGRIVALVEAWGLAPARALDGVAFAAGTALAGGAFIDERGHLRHGDDDAKVAARLSVAAAAGQQRMVLGAGGCTDPHRSHSLAIGLLATLARFSEARSRALVGLFLSFMRDDFYSSSQRADPDASELQLAGVIGMAKDRIAALEAAGVTTVGASALDEAAPGGTAKAADAAEARVVERLALQRLVRGCNAALAFPLPNRSGTARLRDWLGLFKVFRKPGTSMGGMELHGLYIRLLGKPFGGISQAALPCLLTFQEEHTVPYADILSRMVSPNEFRRVMTHFDVSEASSAKAIAEHVDAMAMAASSSGAATDDEGPRAVLPHHRKGVIPVMVRILMGQVLGRPGKGRGGVRASQAARRSAILSFLSRLSSEESSLVVHVAMRAFVPPVAARCLEASACAAAPDGEFPAADTIWAPEAHTDATGFAALVSAIDPQLETISASVGHGFLMLAGDLFKHCGAQLEPYRHRVLAVVVALIRACAPHSATAEEVADDEAAEAEPATADDAGVTEDEDDVDGFAMAGPRSAQTPSATSHHHQNTAPPLQARARTIRTLAVLRLRDAALQHPGEPLEAEVSMALSAMASALHGLPLASVAAGKPPALLLLLQALCGSDVQAPLMASCPHALPALVGTLSAGLTASAVTDGFGDVDRVVTGKGAAGTVVAAALSAVCSLLALDAAALGIRGHNGPLSALYADAGVTDPADEPSPEDSSATAPASAVAMLTRSKREPILAPFLPAVLEHLATRMAARSRAPVSAIAVAPRGEPRADVARTVREVFGHTAPEIACSPGAGNGSMPATELLLLAAVGQLLSDTDVAGPLLAAAAASANATRHPSTVPSGCGLLGPTAGGDGGKSSKAAEQQVPDLASTVVSLLAEHIFSASVARKRRSAAAEDPSFDADIGDDPSSDVREGTLAVIQRLALVASRPGRAVEAVAGVLGPGPLRAAPGSARAAAVRVLAAAVDAAGTPLAKEAAVLLVRANTLPSAAAGTGSGGIDDRWDYDAIGSACEELTRPAKIAQLLSEDPSAVPQPAADAPDAVTAWQIVPALFEHLSTLAMDSDMATRSAAGRAMLAVVAGCCDATAALHSSAGVRSPFAEHGTPSRAAAALGVLAHWISPGIRRGLLAADAACRRSFVQALAELARRASAWDGLEVLLCGRLPSGFDLVRVRAIESARGLPAAVAVAGGDLFYSDLHWLGRDDVALRRGVRATEADPTASSSSSAAAATEAAAQATEAANAAETAAAAAAAASTEADADPQVLEALVDVHLERRARALGKAARILEQSIAAPAGGRALSPRTVQHVLAPLAVHALHDQARAPGRTGAARRARQSGGLHAEAARVIGLCARLVPWRQWLGLLRTLLAQVTEARTPSREDVVVAAVSAVIDSFHFDIRRVEMGADAGKAPVRRQKRGRRGVAKSLAKQARGAAGGKARKDEDKPDKGDDEVAGAGRDEDDADSDAEQDEEEVEEGGKPEQSEENLAANDHAAIKAEAQAASRAFLDDGAAQATLADASTKQEVGSASALASVLTDPSEVTFRLIGVLLRAQDSASQPLAKAGLSSAGVALLAQLADRVMPWDAAAGVLPPGVAASDLPTSHSLAAVQEAADARVAIRTSLLRRVLPAVRGLLRRGAQDAAQADDDARAAGRFSSGTVSRERSARGPASSAGALRPPVAVALTKLLRRLPRSVFRVELPRLLLRVCATLTSRAQNVRDRTRSALGRVAAELGPAGLRPVLMHLKGALREGGFQAHVLGHTMAVVLETLEPQLAMTMPLADKYRADIDDLTVDDVLDDAADAVHADVLPAASLGSGAAALDPSAKADLPLATPTSDQAEPALVEAGVRLPLGSRAIADVLEPLMRSVLADALGAAAEERAVRLQGVRAGGDAREVLTCRAGDIVAVMARTLPFLPHPAVHSLTAPLAAAVADAPGDARVLQTVSDLFRRAWQGLVRNPSVLGSRLAAYSFCVIRDNMSVQGVLRRDVFELMQAQKAAKAVRATSSSSNARSIFDSPDVGSEAQAAARALEDDDSPAPVEQGLRAIIAAAATAQTVAAADVRRFRRSNVATWSVKSGVSPALAAASAAPGALTSSAAAAGRAPSHTRSTVAASAVAARTAFPSDTHRVLPEPKYTGTGRLVYDPDGSLAEAERAGGGGGSAEASSAMLGFSLSLVLGGLSRGTVSIHREAAAAGVLSRMVPLLLRCVATLRADEAVATALRAIAQMSPLPLPAFRDHGKALCRAVMMVLSSSSDVGGGTGIAGATRAGDGNSGITVRRERTSLAAAAVRAATAVLLHVPTARPSSAQVRAMLSVIRPDLTAPSRQGAALALLRAAVTRRMVAPEVYDAMDDVARMMVRSLQPASRTKASRLFLLFLMNYPLTDARLRAHLAFFLRNLDYSEPHGRLAVLDVLTTVAGRFPVAALDREGPVMFVAVLTKLASDSDPRCRAAAGAMISMLLSRTSLTTAVALARMLPRWLRASQQPAVRQAAAQVAGIFAEARPEALTTAFGTERGSKGGKAKSAGAGDEAAAAPASTVLGLLVPRLLQQVSGGMKQAEAAQEKYQATVDAAAAASAKARGAGLTTKRHMAAANAAAAQAIGALLLGGGDAPAAGASVALQGLAKGSSDSDSESSSDDDAPMTSAQFMDSLFDGLMGSAAAGGAVTDSESDPATQAQERAAALARGEVPGAADDEEDDDEGSDADSNVDSEEESEASGSEDDEEPAASAAVSKATSTTSGVAVAVTPAERTGSNWKEDSDGWITVGPGGGDVVKIMEERAKMAAARPRMLPTDDVQPGGAEGDDDDADEAGNGSSSSSVAAAAATTAAGDKMRPEDVVSTLVRAAGELVSKREDLEAITVGGGGRGGGGQVLAMRSAGVVDGQSAAAKAFERRRDLAAEASEAAEEARRDALASLDWQVSYFALMTLSKLLAALPKQLDAVLAAPHSGSTYGAELLEAASAATVFPHQWVRVAAARFTAAAVAAGTHRAAGAVSAKLSTAFGKVLAESEPVRTLLVRKLCSVLASPTVDQETANTAATALGVLAPLARSFSPQEALAVAPPRLLKAMQRDVEALSSVVAPEATDSAASAAASAGLLTGEAATAAVVATAGEGPVTDLAKEAGGDDDVCMFAVRRATWCAVNGSIAARKAVPAFLDVLSASMPPQDSLAYLAPIARAIFSVTADPTEPLLPPPRTRWESPTDRATTVLQLNQEASSIRQACSVLSEQLQDRLGPSAFLLAYNESRSQRVAARRKRRRESALSKALDPEMEFAIVSDLDHKSHYCGIFPTTQMAGDVTPDVPESPPCDGVPLDQHWWISFLRRGVLRIVKGATGSEGRAKYPTYAVEFLETRVLQTQSATRGRSMELSELVRFRHLVLAVCDITGLVWKVQVSDGSVLQRHAIAGGNGDVSRPGKLEWATRKDGRLVMGSVGNRQMDARTGAFLDRNSEWVKVLSAGGTIENSDWGPVFAALRTAAGVRGEGYLWHEAVEWDALSRRWIVLPRKRGFVTPFEPTTDESMGTNVLLVADEDFRHINVSSVGPLEPEWGFSSVRRVPGMRDIFAALKCREVDGTMQTRLTVFTLDGHFLLEDGPWLDLGNVKYEGFEFLGFHPLV